MAWILKTNEKLSYVGQIASPLAFLSSINLRFHIHTGQAIGPQHASVYIETRCRAHLSIKAPPVLAPTLRQEI